MLDSQIFFDDFCSISFLELATDSYINPQSYKEKTKEPMKFLKHCHVKFIENYNSGEIVDVPGKIKVQELQSYIKSNWNYGIGELLPITRDLFTSCGLIILINSDIKQLNKDMEIIKSMERNQGLFTVK